MTSSYGSIWRRWDLHVHSPASVLHNEFAGDSEEDKWDRYLARLEELSGIAALGITDYFSVDGYLRVAAARDAGRVRNIDFVFPNVELRITPVTAEERAINIHILASPEIALELDTMLFSNLEFEYDGNTYRCNRLDLERLGKAVERNQHLDDRAAYEIGVNQFKTNAGQIRKALRNNRRLRDNVLIVVPNRSGDGNSGIQDDALSATRQQIYRLSHAIFSSNPADREYFLGKGVDRPEQVIATCGGLKPCIHGSDAHSLERIGEPDEQRYTWIKADTTFEGLKQICYEPEFRVRIGPTRPIEPFHRIDRLRINVPADAEIVSDDYKDRFCFAGVHHLYFAPGLTCLIGGRGSGKSTVLNLMQEALTGKSAFFRRNVVYSAGSPLDLQRHVEVELLGSPTGVEFLTQNEVEQFAIDQDRFTNAIYTRLLRLDADGALERAEAALEAELALLDESIQLVEQEQFLAREVERVQAEIATNQNLVQSLEDPEYTRLSAEAREVAERLTIERGARQRLRQLVDRVEQAIASEQRRASNQEGGFETRRLAFLASIDRAIAEVRADGDFSAPSAVESELESRAAALQTSLHTYLADRQISAENIQDLSRAASQLSRLQSEASGFNESLLSVRKRQDELDHNAQAFAAYESTIEAAVAPVNGKLQGMGLEVGRINLQYRFDRDAATQALVADLAERLAPLTDSGRTPRTDHILSMLGDIDLLVPPNLGDLIARLGSRDLSQKTLQLLLDYFQDPFNYRAFALRASRTAFDARRFRRIRVSYDGKPLQNASFGQRCSAALILLLTLGNTPIVIDEPEAHLDSALIANLLVLLIKVIKTDRQIIFATHNANFVVNGDAELIHILEMDETRMSRVVSTTLENVEHRPRVLALEGGEKAFQHREERYGLRHLVE